METESPEKRLERISPSMINMPSSASNIRSASEGTPGMYQILQEPPRYEPFWISVMRVVDHGSVSVALRVLEMPDTVTPPAR